MADDEQPHEPGEDAAAERSYVEGLIARGEAAWPDADGKLPPGATHEIVEQEPGKLPKVVRRRFA